MCDCDSLLDDVGPETIASILDAFQEIAITCTHTLQEVIGLLFDHAIADPLLWYASRSWPRRSTCLCVYSQCLLYIVLSTRSDSYAQLCAGISEKTPEFKDGAKTINFRRILLTRCYEALVEEPETVTSTTTSSKSTSSNGATTTTPSAIAGQQQQHSWRRRCMLKNVRLIGELFRRQLLTENVMHVCVAMMLDDEAKPQSEIISAACELLTLVRTTHCDDLSSRARVMG